MKKVTFRLKDDTRITVTAPTESVTHTDNGKIVIFYMSRRNTPETIELPGSCWEKEE